MSARRRVFEFLERHRARVQFAVDSTAWALALVFSLAVRYDFHLRGHHVLNWMGMVPLAVAAQLTAGLAVGLYVGRWQFGSFDEVLGLTRAAAVVTAILFALNVWISDPHLMPRSVVIAGGVTALVLMAGARYAWRLTLEATRRPQGEDVQRVILFGAGEAAVDIIRAMLRDRDGRYLPVALLDDDPGKRNLRIQGVPVEGTRRSLAAAARRHGADTLLVAIPTADATLIREMTAAGQEADLSVKVLPTIDELLGAAPAVTDIRDVTDADLLGRRPVRIDVETIAGYLSDRRVLVTGAGGFIGSELCRQLRRFGPAELVMIDRDEAALYRLQMLLESRASLDSPDLVLLDIRDEARLRRLFAERRPDVVFHAAALKHVPLVERHPQQAVEVNVRAALGVLRAATETGVERFINISTDKAADPAGVLGFTKRLLECAVASTSTGAAYLSVRFGNVLGSPGSVLPTFRAQIENGGPVTVSHAEATRYFMTVEEATQLVIQAGGIGKTGEVLVLDMGEPVKVVDVAERLIAASNRQIEIVFTDSRPGEKVHEVLFGQGENPHRRAHPMISHLAVPPIEPDEIEAGLAGADDDRELVERLRGLCQALAARVNLPSA